MKKITALLLFLSLIIGILIPPSKALPYLAEPSVSAQSAILIDADSGSVLYSKASDVRRGMASTTKIMTALIALETLDMNAVIDIPQEATGIEGSSIYLVPHEKLTVEELIYALLLQSANDAATALAIAISGSVEAFATLMNERADEMGLVDTHFTNPHGLYDDEHYTTAQELAVITRNALKNDVFAKVVATQKKTVSTLQNPRTLVNHNKLLRTYEGCVGVKTGFTKKTGRCLVSAAERDGLLLIAVTLDAPSDWQDHKNMFDFGFGGFESVLVYGAGAFSYSLPLTDAQKSHVRLTNACDIRLTMPKIRGNITQKIELLHRFEFAPLTRGQELGRITVSFGEISASSPLVCTENAEQNRQKNIFEKLFGFF